MAVRFVDDGLWCVEGFSRFAGQRIPARTTLVSLPSGGLLAYSPIRLEPDIICELRELGGVSMLLAPSCLHYGWLTEWAAAFPDARVLGAPGLREKHPSLPIDAVLDDAPPDAWQGALEHQVIRAISMANEIAVFHRTSGTIMFCDLAFNVRDADSRIGEWVMRLNGMWNRFGPSRAMRLILRRRFLEAQVSLNAVVAWDFDRVIPAHGDIVDVGGKDAMRQAFASFLAE